MAYVTPVQYLCLRLGRKDGEPAAVAAAYH